MPAHSRQVWLSRTIGCTLMCGTLAAFTGCQVDVGGQTLPSGYYLKDDIQYFPTGPKFKLAQEAAAMKAYNEQQALQTQPSVQ
ncbi:MAG: hypothetical protein SFX18_18015 [Pirellulales bacterium]|nr:hypothetical protein [Pirellulales bacterium]